MNQIETQPKQEIGLERAQEILPPTAVEETGVSQEPSVPEVSTPPVSPEAEESIYPNVEETKPVLSYGYPLEQTGEEDNPANMVAQKIQGLPPQE